jgi:hypothetical protein
MLPKLNKKRAKFVLTKIDEILAWEQRREAERDTRFVELGRYLCEVRAGQYWRVENLKSFDEFLERRFPESRRKAYYLMSIHEHLPPQVRNELKEIGWTKGRELAKLARAEGQRFVCAPWVHKARSMPREEFKREVEKELTGRETEPHEIMYFKMYKSQIPVIEQALETAALMLGTDKSRGYCLEMICADFLAGANLENENPNVLLESVTRFFKFLPDRVIEETACSALARELSRSGEPWHRIERLEYIVDWFDRWMMGVPHPEFDINPGQPGAVARFPALAILTFRIGSLSPPWLTSAIALSLHRCPSSSSTGLDDSRELLHPPSLHSICISPASAAPAASF